MTTPHRTLQMALDALDAITDDVDGTGLNTMPSFDKAIDAIAALREALAPDHLRDVAEKVAPAAPVVPLTDDRLHTFLNAAASEGLVLDGVDAADLYIATFPERYVAVVASIEGHGIAASPEQPK